jgi:hypothetical protein
MGVLSAYGKGGDVEIASPSVVRSHVHVLEKGEE